MSQSVDDKLPGVGKEVYVAQIADLLELEGGYFARMARARYWLQGLGIARQKKPKGRFYCTLSELRDNAPHVWLAYQMAYGEESL